jgi:hypothetical protein
MILAIGYRVRSNVGVQFRNWASSKDIGISKNYLQQDELDEDFEGFA